MMYVEKTYIIFMKKYLAAVAVLVVAASGMVSRGIMKEAHGAYHFAGFLGTPPIHILRSAQKTPAGLTPVEVKRIYNLPQSGGQGTIALVEAYDAPTMRKIWIHSMICTGFPYAP